jgi:murein DD-endopeptidase MepM/ murein hydrolase activator NlpD
MKAFKTAAAITVLSAALGACAVDLTARPQYSIHPEPTPPAPAAVTPPPASPAPVAPVGDAPVAHPSQPVQSQPLPPASSAPRPGAALDSRYVQDVMMFAAASEDSVTVGKGDSLAKIAKKAGVSVDDLIKANKLDDPYKLKPGQKLVLPGAAPAEEPSSAQTAKSAKTAKGKKASAKSEPKPEPKPAPEPLTVGKGDTLQKLAKKAGVSMDDLAKANHIEAPYRLKLGQKLALPDGAESDAAPASSAAPSPAKAKASAKAEPTSVKVGRGDTLATIADKAGVSQAELARLNHLKKPYRVKRGQTIKLPGAEASNDAVSNAIRDSSPSSVKVGKGETLQTIAEKQGVSVAELAKLNHLKKPYRVKRGQTIKLPVEAASDAAPAPRGEPPRTIVAGRHDTLQSIADKEDVPVAELAKLNHLKKPYRIKRGQKIRLPGRPAPAPAPVTAYTVKRGDSLYSIARQFNVSAKALADANGLDIDDHVQAGRRLQLPGGPLDQPIPRPRIQAAPPVPYNAAPSNPPPPPAPLAAPSPIQPPPAASNFGQTYSRPQAPAAEASSPADSDVAAAGRGFFRWPVRGAILSAYGPKAGGQRNDGIDISAASGDPVQAAAAGEIVYAGNSVPGFGNLVLIRHDGGWVTVYAHLSNIDVKMRQLVAQGQQIGEVGMTGGVDLPQLHFEVRYAPNPKDKARQIDPALVLP